MSIHKGNSHFVLMLTLSVFLVSLFFVKSSNSPIPNSKTKSIETPAKLRLSLDKEKLQIQELNSIIDPFSPCLIHLINFESIDFSPFHLPIVLEQYKSITGTGIAYYSSDAEGARLISSQRDNFRWKCVFHGFIHPHLEPVVGKIVPSAPRFYSSYWTGKGPYTNKHRQWDYYFLFTAREKVVEEWKLWIFGVELAQGQGVFGGPSNNGIIHFDMNRTSPTFDLYLACHFCHPEEYTFEKIGNLGKIESLESIDTKFKEIRSTLHPNIPIIISSLDYQGPIKETFTTKQPTFFNVSERGLCDFLVFEIIYPNTTYQKDFVRLTTMRMTSQPPWIQMRVTKAPYFDILESSYKFLTCDGAAVIRNPSFYAFVSAYRPTTWGFLLASAIAMIVALKMVFKMANIDGNAFFVPFLSLLEQGVEIGSDSQRVLSMSWIMGVWLLMSVILSNAYKGQNITELTSPLKPILVERFDEITERNFTLFHPIYLMYSFDNHEFFEQDREKYTKFNFEFEAYKQNLGGERQNWTQMDLEEVEKIERVDERVFILKAKHNITLLESILTCNKTALLAYADDVDVYEDELKRRKTKEFIAKSKESILTDRKGWNLQNVMNPYVHMRLQSIAHSGLLEMWRKYQKFLRSIRFVEKSNVNGDYEKTKELTLEGNFRIVFYLFVALLFFDCLVMIGELVQLGCQKCKRRNDNVTVITVLKVYQ